MDTAFNSETAQRISGKERALEAALSLFVKKGYEGAALNEILKTAGVGKGTFYNRFQDKADLYITLLDRALSSREEYVDKVRTPSSSADFYPVLCDLVHAYASFAADYPGYAAFLSRFENERGNAIYNIAVTRLGERCLCISKPTLACYDGPFARDFAENAVAAVLSAFGYGMGDGEEAIAQFLCNALGQHLYIKNSNHTAFKTDLSLKISEAARRDEPPAPTPKKKNNDDFAWMD